MACDAPAALPSESSVPPAPPASSSPPRRPEGRRAPHRRRGAATAVAQERLVSAEGKSKVAPGPAAPAPSGHRAVPLSWLSSVPVGRSTSHAPHHGCDEGRQPAPLRRSAARAHASSAAVAPSSASRKTSRHQPPWIDSKGQTKTCPRSTRGRLEQDGTWW